MITIVFKNRHVVIINKPAGVPSQPDPTGDSDAISLTAALLGELGESEALWPVHRLDRGVGGLLALARTKSAAAELSALVSLGGIGKEYLAVAKGEVTSGVYYDYLFKDSRTNKSFAVSTPRKGAKEAELSLNRIATAQGTYSDISLCRIKLKTGRHHQIRCQLATRGNPLVGDRKYGGADASSSGISLFAYRLDFELFGERISAVRLPRLDKYPWNKFVEEISDLE